MIGIPFGPNMETQGLGIHKICRLPLRADHIDKVSLKRQRNIVVGGRQHRQVVAKRRQLDNVIGGSRQRRHDVVECDHSTTLSARGVDNKASGAKLELCLNAKIS